MRFGVGGFAAVLLACSLAVSPAFADRRAPSIEVLSNRGDIVSGGDAYVRVNLPPRTRRSKVRMTLGNRNVTSAFGTGVDGNYVGVVKGLATGTNVLTARLPNGWGARLKITNRPIGGPVLAGPQIQPWACFAGSLDRQCNRPPSYSFSYKSTQGGGFQSYDPAHPPSDVATTTTDQGRKVPFIVRQETGTIDRDQYRIAVLYDPKQPWSPASPQAGFNHKLVIFHGFSCDTQYEQADAPDVMNETALGRGFATMSHALDNAGHNCNLLTQAEALIMTKEYLVDHYGTIRYTIGSGCSGGSLVQQQVANAYPGVYQGITPQCSFPDAWSSAMQYVDYQLLRRYYENPASWGTGVAWTPDQISAVEGHPDPANAVTFTTVIPSSGEPTRSCPGVPQSQVYDEHTNPHGVRCTLTDYMINVFGPRPQDGFAGRPLGNVGFQYGLRALQAGKISPAQFVDLNQKIGAFDIDYNPTSQRVDADKPADARVYRSGAVNTAENLDKVAIIDLRGPDPGAFHDVYRTYVMRARLMREHGTAANQILWRGQAPLIGDANYVAQSIVAMDGWLSAVERDKRKVPLAKKILQDKPGSVNDRCTDGDGHEQPASTCDATVQSYSDPEIEGGMPLTHDTLRCQLKPLRRSDYGGFSDAQWSELQKQFPRGVCDFSKPAQDRVRTNTWQTYQDRSGKVIYGGRPLGPAPVSEPFGCLARRSPIGPRNIGRVRIGSTRARLLKRVPGPGRTSRRAWRWCVTSSKGTVRAAFTRGGKVALVATTARRHGNRRLHPGSRVRALRRAYPRRRAVGRGVFRAGPRSPRLIGVRHGRVTYIAVASRGLLRHRATLRRYLRLAGVVRAPRRRR